MTKTKFKALDTAESRLGDLIREEDSAFEAVKRAEREFGAEAYETVQARRRFAQVAVRVRDQKNVVESLGGYDW